MKNRKSSLKDDMDILRQTLHSALASEKDDKILQVSQELDELIVEYTKQYSQVVA